MDDREPSITLAWLFILVFLPLIGVFFYIFFGRDWKVVAQRKGWIQTLKRVETEEMAPIYERNAGATERFRREWAGTIAAPISRAITSENVASVLPAASVELFITGQEKFARLKEDLAGAQRFIHLQYFIWEQDRLTAELVPILLDRLAAGVEVRIMYDWMGCISFKKFELKQLAKAGALVRADVTDLLRINYRNHRKIVVIDGEIGYTGGMNVGQEYIDGGERFATWRDTHLRLTGQAVAGLEKLYASRWFEHKKDHEDLFAQQYMPAPDPAAVETGTLVEIAAQGVEDPWSAARRAHMVAIGQAEESVWIQSPYFVPDYSVYDVMINAALSGIDVRFMMTGVPDKRLPYYAAQTYYRKLIEAGGKVYKYEAGFFHSKTIVVDGLVGAVGTMNMDQRSLKLHKELMCWVFDKDFAQQCSRRVPRRHGELPRGDSRRRAVGPPPEEVPQPGGPAPVQRPLRAAGVSAMPPGDDDRLEVKAVRSRPRHTVLKRVVVLGVTAAGLYVVWPNLAKVFTAGPMLATVNPLWGLPLVAAEAASFVCIWALLRLALDVKPWFPDRHRAARGQRLQPHRSRRSGGGRRDAVRHAQHRRHRAGARRHQRHRRLSDLDGDAARPAGHQHRGHPDHRRVGGAQPVPGRIDRRGRLSGGHGRRGGPAVRRPPPDLARRPDPAGA